MSCAGWLIGLQACSRNCHSSRQQVLICTELGWGGEAGWGLWVVWGGCLGRFQEEERSSRDGWWGRVHARMALHLLLALLGSTAVGVLY